MNKEKGTAKHITAPRLSGARSNSVLLINELFSPKPTPAAYFEVRPFEALVRLTVIYLVKCLLLSFKRILRSFDLGHKWEKENGRWQKTEKVDNSRTPDILFIERCLQLLRPGGRMAIVLPDGILGNSGLEYVRHYILEKTYLIGVIDCPTETFLPSVDTKTSVLVLKKKKKELPQTFDVFMSIAETCGHDRRGKILYNRDKKGEIVLDDDGKPTIDNNLLKISSEFRKYVKSKNLYD